ncbi:hypothetical protein C8Q77DRAFT_158474 [Trametes polyzona]|nr:hypothetical protein C8Q77DRAFT_158474 [Trametes polyzona]
MIVPRNPARAESTSSSRRNMAHKAVRLDPDEFACHFLRSAACPSHDANSISLNAIPRWEPEVFKDLEAADGLRESEILKRFIHAVRMVVTSGLKLSESQRRPGKGNSASSAQTIDVAFFRPAQLPANGLPHWTDQMVAVEVREDGTQSDPFDGQEEHVYWDSDKRQQIWDELSEHAEHVFRYQRRTALFMLLIIGRRFRFLRWDRSGTIVTPFVDYYEQSQVLCEMLWRMAQLSDEELGCDPSATRLYRTDADYITMTTFALPLTDDFEDTEGVDVPNGNHLFRYVREMFRHSILGDWPRYRLKVVQGGKKFLFLVGKPVFHSSGMAGRGTQGFVAYDLQRKRFVWLKDAWRAHYDFVDQEGIILMQLNSTKDAEGNPSPVTNVPTVVCHGDVQGQTTRTPEFWEMKNKTTNSQDVPCPLQQTQQNQAMFTGSASRAATHSQASAGTKGRKRSRAEAEKKTPDLDNCPLRRHMHYRLIVEEVAMPLREFQSGYQLVTIVLDCMIAHEDAINKAQILHRDISGGNILIYPRTTRLKSSPDKCRVRWRGLLADWELSKPMGGDQGDRARQPERTGTWQYMSVAVLLDHSKVVEISDELESFFHVLLYYSLRYLRSNCTLVGEFIEEYFDSFSTGVDGKYCCGARKINIIKGREKLTIAPSSEELIRFDSEPLNTMFKEILEAFNGHYTVKAYDERDQLHPSTSPPSQLPQPKAPLPPDPFSDEEDSDPFASRFPSTNHMGPASSNIAPPRLPKPSIEEYANAETARCHQGIQGIVHAAYKERSKFTLDRVDDNVPVTYKAKGRVDRGDTAATRTMKKRRMETITERAEGDHAAKRHPPLKMVSCKI